MSLSLKLLSFATFLFCLTAADNPHQRMVDDFSTARKWDPQIIEPNYNKDPIYSVGLWSRPVDGGSFKVVNGKGIFNVKKLSGYPKGGFELAYHLENNNEGAKEFDGTNYLSFDIANKSSETVWGHFRAFDEINYTYVNGKVPSTALVELKMEPDSFVLKPNSGVQKVVMKLARPSLSGDILNPVYKNWLKFFAFEIRGVKSTADKHNEFNCTLEMDNLMILDAEGAGMK